MAKPKILAFAGSLRRDSSNKKLIRIAIAAAQQAGADVTYIDLKDYPMPVYDQDIEDSEGLPQNALKLKEMMNANQGLLISAPEYNSSISGALKNFIDWCSRKESPNEPDLINFKGKVAALMSASPGNLGGLRGLVHVRDILENIGVLVLPQQKCISNAHQAFGPDGKLLNQNDQKAIENLSAKLVEILNKIGT